MVYFRVYPRIAKDLRVKQLETNEVRKRRSYNG